ncbi:MAG TPA: hypothetical protein VF653_04180 [Methylomirabilota bacterium]
MTGWVVAVTAVAVGAVHAVLLRRAARLGAGPVGLVARLLLVAALLVIGARSGWLVTGAVSWGTGFAGGVLVLASRWR